MEDYEIEVNGKYEVVEVMKVEFDDECGHYFSVGEVAIVVLVRENEVNFIMKGNVEFSCNIKMFKQHFRPLKYDDSLNIKENCNETVV